MSSTNNNSTPVENVAPQSPEQNKETQKLADPKATPAIVRARQQRREFLVSSPSDSLLSPCTKKLVGRTARTQVSHPINILRAKQQMGIPKMADLNDQGSASEEQQNADAESVLRFGGLSRLLPMICFLNCLNNSGSHLCYCRTTQEGMGYAIRHDPSRFPLLHLSISEIACNHLRLYTSRSAMPTSNSSEETSRWNCETERTNSSRTTEFGTRGDDLRNAMSDGDLLDCSTPYSHYPFMSARGMDFVFERSASRIPSYSYETSRHRRPSLAQISQVSVDSNFSARLDQPSLKVERIRLKSINCKLSAKLEVRRRAERRRFKETKCQFRLKSSDSSETDSPLHRPKSNSCSVRRSKRGSPETSELRLTSSSGAEDDDEQEVSDDRNTFVNNLSDQLRLFAVDNGHIDNSPTHKSPKVPYLQLNTQYSDSSPRQSGSSKRDIFEKLSYESEMREVLKGDAKSPVEPNSPQEASAHSTPPHIVFERDENGDFRPAPSYFRIHRASLPTFSLKDSEFGRPAAESFKRRSTIFEENNISFVTDDFATPIVNGDNEEENDDGSHIENNRSEGSEITVEVSTSIKPEVPEVPTVDVEEPSSSKQSAIQLEKKETNANNNIHGLLPKDLINSKLRISGVPGLPNSNWVYEVNMCKLLKLLFSEKERLESSIASASKNMPLCFASTRSQLAQERYRQHLRESLRKVQNRIDAILSQLASSKKRGTA